MIRTGLLGWICRRLGADRIRVSPREGKLLRLVPPCFLRIDHTEYRLLRRTVQQDQSGAAVIYDLEAREGGRCTLTVHPPSLPGPARAELRCGTLVRPIGEADVEVLGAAL